MDDIIETPCIKYMYDIDNILRVLKLFVLAKTTVNL